MNGFVRFQLRFTQICLLSFDHSCFEFHVQFFAWCNTFVRLVLALFVGAGSGSYPSQLDQAHLREELGWGGDQLDPYNTETAGGEYKVVVRPPPSHASQPYAQPSQFDTAHRTQRGQAGGGRYEPYSADSARGGDYSARNAPNRDRKVPSQYDQEHRRGMGQGPEGQYRGYQPGIAGRDQDRRWGPNRERSVPSQFDQEHRSAVGTRPGEQYRTHQPDASARDKDSGWTAPRSPNWGPNRDRSVPSQYDQEQRSRLGSGPEDQYRGYQPGASARDGDLGRTGPGGAPRSPHASQLDRAHWEDPSKAAEGQYQGHAPGYTSAPYDNRRGPPGLHGFLLHLSFCCQHGHFCFRGVIHCALTIRKLAPNCTKGLTPLFYQHQFELWKQSGNADIDFGVSSKTSLTFHHLVAWLFV